MCVHIYFYIFICTYEGVFGYLSTQRKTLSGPLLTIISDSLEEWDSGNRKEEFCCKFLHC